MAVQLSSLRVTADMDASGYVRGAAAIDEANRQMAASGTLAGAQLAQQDVTAGRTGGTLVSLSKANVDGYASASQFARGIAQLQTQMELGNVSADRGAKIYTGLVNRFGMVADAVAIAKTGNRDFASVIDGVNKVVGIQPGMLGATAAGMKSASSEAAKLAGEATGLGAATAFGNTQFMALTAAIRHSIDAIIAGRPVTQALAMEMGNLSYGLSGAGGVMGALKAIGSSVLGFLSPVVLMFAAITAAVVYSIVALTRFQSAQADIKRQMTGSGVASGASVGDINAVSAIGPDYKLSISQAGNLATALAATGKVGVDSLAPIVKLGHDFAATLGINATEAAKELAKAFADPVKGATTLNDRLGFLDASTKNLIDSLVTQGRRQDAIAVLTDRVKTSIASASEVTSVWALAWDHVSNSISNGTIYWGQFLDRMAGGAGGATVEKQISDLTIKLLELQKAQILQQRSGSPLIAMLGLQSQHDIDQITAAIEKLREKQLEANKATQDANIAQRSLELKGFVDALDPAPEKLRKLVDRAIGLNQALSNPALGTFTAALRAAGAALSATLNEMDPVRNAIAQTADQIKALDDRSVAGLRARAEAEARRRLSGTGLSPQEMETQVGQAGQLASGGATRADADIAARINLLGSQATVQQRVALTQIAINNAARDGVTITGTQADNLKRLAEETALGTYAMKQQADTSKIEADTLGMTTGAATAYRLEQERIALALRNKETLSAKNLADLHTEAQAAGAAAQALALRNLQYDIKRGSQTAFLTSEDVQIAEKLKAVYPDVATALNSVEAAQIRANNAVSGLSQEISGGLSTALLDVSMGTKSAGDAFRSFGLLAVQALEKTIIQLAIIGPLMRGLQGGLGGGGILSSLFGGSSSAMNLGTAGGTSGGLGGLFANGGVMTSRGQIPLNRYAGGGVANSAQVAIFGEGRTPEAYVPLPDGRSIPVNINVPTATSGGGSTVHIAPTYNIDARGSQMTEEQFQAILVKNNAQLAKDINRGLPDRVAAINRDPRRR